MPITQEQCQQSQDTKPQKPHISATQLEMFWRCAEQYRRRYIEGERIPPAVALIQGRAFHIGAETNFRQKIESHADLAATEIVEAAAAAFDAELAGGYALTDEEVSRGAASVLGAAKDKTVQLVACHADEQAPDYQPVAVEHTTRIVFPQATHDLLGVTDLRDERGRVVDFKTAARKPSAEAADSSTQLTIYAAAFHVDTGTTPEEVRLDVVTKTKTPARHVVRSRRTPTDMQVLLNRVNVTLDSLNKGSFPPASPGAWCCSPKWCGYWATCPYVNSERRQAAERK
jgi:hypothetical protein